MQYRWSRYRCDDTLAIQAYTDDMEPWCMVTVNLSDYGITPPEGCVFIPTYKMDDETIAQIISDLVERVIGEVQIGFGKGLLVLLRDDWKDIVKEM